MEEKQRSDGNEGVERECVILVGKTGTGKTTILNTYTGAEEPTGSSATSITKQSILIKDKLHSNGPHWLDNTGWSDSDGKSDASIYKDLLRKLQNENIYRVKALIWTISPQPRSDATLQAQAKFIHDFTKGQEEGKIWSNVIIVAKGKTSQNLEEDCQGARTAAMRQYVHANPICLGWGLADQELVQETTTDFRTRKLRMLLPEEIRRELEDALAELPPSVQVVFANHRCKACGQTGDPRLMEDKCHRKKVKGHTGTLKIPKARILGATVAGIAVAAAAVTGIVGAAKGLPEMAKAATSVMNHGGQIHSVLDSRSASPFDLAKDYTCCNKKEGSEGCTDVCDSCNAKWGDGNPCVYIRNPEQGHQSGSETYEVYLKDHELVKNVSN